MRRHLILGLIAATISAPSIAAAQQTCQQHHSDNKVIGTVIGAGLGALFGNAVASGGGKPGGTIIGGVAGGVVGNQVAGSGNSNCENQGYYDRDGHWVSSASASGYYDANGRWVATQQGGYYDRDGRWVSTAPGGYYDSQGRWVAASSSYAGDAGANAAYRGGDIWADAPRDTREREDWLESRIRQDRDNGQMPPERADHALSELHSVRSQDQQYRQYDNGDLTPRERGYIEARLDDLRRSLPS